MKHENMTPYSVAVFVLLTGMFQGSREQPCQRSLALDETVVLRKGEHRLALALHEILKEEQWTIPGFQPMKAPARRVLTVSVRNVGNTRWDGRCETLFSISKEGAVEFIIAFAPGALTCWRYERAKS